MARTFADYQDIAEHAAGGQIDASIDLAAMVNDAGRYLISLHPWAFLERPVAQLDVVADQDYVELPADFDKLIDVGDTDDYITNTTHLVPADRLERIRLNSIGGDHETYLALVWPTQASTAASPDRPRLAIYPTPVADVTGRFWLNYYAGWIKLTNPGDVANIPAGIEHLLVELVRAFARGEATGKGPSEAIEVIERSAMLKRLKQSYGTVNPAPVAMGNGILPPISSIPVHGHRPFFPQFTPPA